MTTVALQQIALSHLTPVQQPQQTSKTTQQQMIASLAGVHPPVSNSVQPIYVNLGGGLTTITTSSSNTGKNRWWKLLMFWVFTLFYAQVFFGRVTKRLCLWNAFD